MQDGTEEAKADKARFCAARMRLHVSRMQWYAVGRGDSRLVESDEVDEEERTNRGLTNCYFQDGPHTPLKSSRSKSCRKAALI